MKIRPVNLSKSDQWGISFGLMLAAMLMDILGIYPTAYIAGTGATVAALWAVMTD